MNPLDPRLLDALRAERAAPADARVRVRARLEAALPEMGSSGGGGGAGGAGAAAGAFGSRLTTAVALFLAGGVAGAALLSALSGAKPARVVYVDRPVPVAGAMAPLMLAPAPVTDGTPWSIARPEEGPAKAPRAARPADLHASRLAAEQHLLDAARAAIVAGEPERAVTQLERHRAQFPDGLLVEERDAMMVEALAKSSRTSEARALAESFRARYPGSLFTATVDSAVAPSP